MSRDELERDEGPYQFEIDADKVLAEGNEIQIRDELMSLSTSDVEKNKDSLESVLYLDNGAFEDRDYSFAIQQESPYLVDRHGVPIPLENRVVEISHTEMSSAEVASEAEQAGLSQWDWLCLNNYVPIEDHEYLAKPTTAPAKKAPPRGPDKMTQSENEEWRSGDKQKAAGSRLVTNLAGGFGRIR